MLISLLEKVKHILNLYFKCSVSSTHIVHNILYNQYFFFSIMTITVLKLYIIRTDEINEQQSIW